MECGSADHTALCVWSSFTLLILIIFVYFRAKSQDIYQHDPRLPKRLRHDVHNLDAYYSIFRLIALIMVIIVAESNPIVSSILLLIVFLIPIIWTIYTLPFVNMIFNFIHCVIVYCGNY